MSVSKFKEAIGLATKEHWDIAIVDLNWSDKPEKERAGWDIIDALPTSEYGKKTKEVIYSGWLRPNDLAGAAETRILAFPKHRIAPKMSENAPALKRIVSQLAWQVDELEAQSKKLASIEQKKECLHHVLEMYRRLELKMRSEEKIFQRVITTIFIVPTIAFVLLTAAWLLTEKFEIALLASVGSAFLTLAALRGAKVLSKGDLR